MKNHIALFDLDNTIYKTHSFFEIVDAAVKENLVNKQVQVAILDLLDKYKKKEMTYNEAANEMLKVWVKELKGKRYEDFFTLAKNHFIEHENDFYSYYHKLLPELKESYDVYLITNNAQFVAEAVSEIYQLTDYISTLFEVYKEKFTGEILMTLADGKKTVDSLIEKYGKERSIAVGDSANDIEMLSAVEYSFCFEPDKDLEKVGKKNKWETVDEENAYEKLGAIL